MYYWCSRRRYHHLRLYVSIEVQTNRTIVDGAYAFAGRFKRIFMGVAIPFRIFVLYDKIKRIFFIVKIL